MRWRNEYFWVLGVALLAALVKGAPTLTTRAHVTPEEKELVLRTFEEHGFPRDEAERVIRHESGWNPAARNPRGGAAGLIQFMPATLKGLGFHPELDDHARSLAFTTLSVAEQVPWISKYLAHGPKWHYRGDTYLRIFWPAAVGQPDDHIIASSSSEGFLKKVWIQNPSLRAGLDGPITAGSVRARAA